MPDAPLPGFAHRLLVLAGLILAIIVAGATGLELTEGRGLWESFVWSVDTVATIGSLPPPETAAGQVVKVLLIVLGVGSLFYALVAATELFVTGHVGELLEQRRLQRMTDALSDHYLICGYGRVGRQVARDLRAAGASYVVIDQNPLHGTEVGVGVRFLQGAPSDEALLRQAGIDRARALIACMDSDAENVFTTLTARELRPDIAIVARASREDAEPRLRRAGADRVISPYRTSGAEMARLAMHPQLTGTLDVDAEYRVDELLVGEACRASGMAIADVRGDAFIAGLRRAGAFTPQPPGHTTLHPGDVLLVMGTPATLERLERLFDPEKAEAR